MEIQTRFDSKRGCGYRKDCKLPFALTVCPTCHARRDKTNTWMDIGRCGGAVYNTAVCRSRLWMPVR